MLPKRNRLEPWQKLLVYGLSSVLFLSGVLWFGLDRWGEVEGDFGPAKNPLQHPVLILHGSASLLYLMVVGSVVTLHVKRGWQQLALRGQALVLLLVQAILILSTPVILYAAHQGLRELGATLHLIAGLLMAAVLPIHIWLSRRSYLSKKNRQTKATV